MKVRLKDTIVYRGGLLVICHKLKVVKHLEHRLQQLDCNQTQHIFSQSLQVTMLAMVKRLMRQHLRQVSNEIILTDKPHEEMR